MFTRIRREHECSAGSVFDFFNTFFSLLLCETPLVIHEYIIEEEYVMNIIRIRQYLIRFAPFFSSYFGSRYSNNVWSFFLFILFFPGHDFVCWGPRGRSSVRQFTTSRVLFVRFFEKKKIITSRFDRWDFLYSAGSNFSK